jgi:nitrate/nitrite-specific signal transduction histidine kinase
MQEALYNVIKHAHTEAASVVIGLHEEEVTVQITDEGVGSTRTSTQAIWVCDRCGHERRAWAAKCRSAGSPGAGSTVTVKVSGTAREILATAP